MNKKFKFQQTNYVCASSLVLLLLLTLLALRVAPVYAQGSRELLTNISQQIGQSMQALIGYSYQQRTEVQVNGETKSVRLVQVAFGPDRQPLITPISSQPPEETERGLRGRIKEKKAE